MKGRVARMSPEFRDLLQHRAKAFSTNMVTEQKNLMKILGEVEHQLGIDFKKTPVINGKAQLNARKKIWVMK